MLGRDFININLFSILIIFGGGDYFISEEIEVDKV